MADEVREEILDRGFRNGVFRQHYETDALDASTLLIPLLRFLPPDDPRVRATVEAIADGPHQTRPRPPLPGRRDRRRPARRGGNLPDLLLLDGLGAVGDRRAAARAELCERLLQAAGSLDLYAEELDARSGRHLGNFPQAFTHLALINAVSHVIADEQRKDGGVTAVFSEMGGVREGVYRPRTAQRLRWRRRNSASTAMLRPA